MTATKTSKAPHRDNIFGICNALGEDFGFNPFYLRAALGVMLLVNPAVMLISYGVAGIVVLVSHLLVPKRAKAVATGQPWSPAIPPVRIADRRETRIDAAPDMPEFATA